jgi:hypothetical protein
VRVMPGVQRGAVLLPAVGLAVVPAACTQRSSARRGEVSREQQSVGSSSPSRESRSSRRTERAQQGHRAGSSSSRRKRGGVQLQVVLQVLQGWYL